MKELDILSDVELFFQLFEATMEFNFKDFFEKRLAEEKARLEAEELAKSQTKTTAP